PESLNTNNSFFILQNDFSNDHLTSSSYNFDLFTDASFFYNTVNIPVDTGSSYNNFDFLISTSLFYNTFDHLIDASSLHNPLILNDSNPKDDFGNDHLFVDVRSSSYNVFAKDDFRIDNYLSSANLNSESVSANSKDYEDLEAPHFRKLTPEILADIKKYIILGQIDSGSGLKIIQGLDTSQMLQMLLNWKEFDLLWIVKAYLEPSSRKLSRLLWISLSQ
ncbi:22611_t:CDS:2, partial [Racocetra persica]